MGEVKHSRKKHWVIALDADLASIPSPEVGDTCLTEDKKKLYYWQGGAWKTGLGYEFVERRAAAPDKQVGDFTTDGAWKVNGLDLSGIVPAGAVAVVLKVVVSDDAAMSAFSVRPNATDTENILSHQVFVANISVVFSQPVSIDSDRLLDYVGSNTVFTTIDVTVVGWYI